VKKLQEFRAAVHAAGERSEIPNLAMILEHRRPAPVRPFRWAVAVALLALASIPVYRNLQRQREAAQERADAQLMERVNAALARPVPRALAPLLGN
jgi:hypothetical protein